MFQIGDYIIYGNAGVCRVEDIMEMDRSGAQEKKLYYQLVPVRIRGGKIFTPVANNKSVMRKILSKEQALELIDDIPRIKKIPIENEKSREAEYKEVIRTCDCHRLVGIIKTMDTRNHERMKLGRKTTAVDEKYLHMAKERLYGELSVAIEKDWEEMEGFIAQRIETGQASAGDGVF